MRKQFIEKCFEQVPSSNNQSSINSNTSSRFNRYYVFAILTIFVLLGIFVQFGGGKNDISKNFNSTANNSSENQKEVDENMGSPTNLNNPQDQKHKPHVNIDQVSDDTVNERPLTTVSDIAPDHSCTQCELNSNIEKLLNMVENIEHRVENIERALQKPTRRKKDDDGQL
jgi:hypothetical protein